MPYAEIKWGHIWHGGLIAVKAEMCLAPDDVRYNDPKFYIIDETSREFELGYTGPVKVVPVDELDYYERRGTIILSINDGFATIVEDAEAYAVWRKGLPRAWTERRKFHNHILYFNPDVSQEDVLATINHHLPNFYQAWGLEYDKLKAGMRRGWDIETRWRARGRPRRFDLEMNAVELTARRLACQDKLDLIVAADLQTYTNKRGETFPSTEIDVGSEAVDRAGYFQHNIYTGVNITNPANDSGSIDSVDFYCQYESGTSDLYFGSFSHGGSNVLTVNDSESVGDATSTGLLQFTGLDISINSGEYIGAFDKGFPGYCRSERDYSGYDGVWAYNGECIDPSDSQTFDVWAGDTLSIYGTGETAGGELQTLIPSGVASAEAVGSLEVGFITKPSAISSAEAFGTSKLNFKLEPSAIATAEALGEPMITHLIAPDGIVSAEALGEPQLNLILAMTGIASAEAIGTAKILLYLLPDAIVSAEALGTPKLVNTISPDAILSAEAIGTPQLNLILAMTGIVSAEAIGSHSLGMYILPDGIATAEAFGTTLLKHAISPSAIDSAEAFGTVKFILHITPSGIATAEAIGTPSLSRYILPSGIATGEAIGEPQLNFVLLPSGIISAEAHGEPNLGLFINPNAITSAEAFGALKLGLKLAPDGILSGEAVGTPQLNYILKLAGIASAEALGEPVLKFTQRIRPTGIITAEQFGTVKFIMAISPSGIASAEAFGTLTLIIITGYGISLYQRDLTEPVAQRDLTEPTSQRDLSESTEQRDLSESLYQRDLSEPISERDK